MMKGHGLDGSDGPYRLWTPLKRGTQELTIWELSAGWDLLPLCSLHVPALDLSSVPSHAACYFLPKKYFHLCLCCQPIYFIHALLVS